MGKIAIILGRFQPIHHGHVQLIHEAKKKYGDVLIIVGKSKEKRERNLFSAEVMLDEVLKSTRLERKSIAILEDLTNENDNSQDWSKYLLDFVKSKTNKDVVFITSPKDLGKYNEWFGDNKDVIIDVLSTNFDISSTIVRDKLSKVNNITPIIPNFNNISNKKYLYLVQQVLVRPHILTIYY